MDYFLKLSYVIFSLCYAAVKDIPGTNYLHDDRFVWVQRVELGA